VCDSHPATEIAILRHSKANWLNLRGVFRGDVRCVTKRQPASDVAVAIREVLEGHIFLSPREIASLVISHHLSQATVALLMSTNRLLTHDVLLLQHREQTAGPIIEERRREYSNWEEVQFSQGGIDGLSETC
jgi:hypothetical protein